MVGKGQNRVRRSLFAALAALLVVLVGVLGRSNAVAQTQPADFDLPGGSGHFYTQTNGGAGPQYGYRITNENNVNFWSEFQRLGGVPALGYPVSRRFTLDGFTVQAMQKVILQWRADANPPQVYFINVFDKLHDMGDDPVLQATYQIPPQLDPSFDAGKTPDQISKARLDLLNQDLKVAARYYNGQSQATAILYNGLPTSQVRNAGPFSIIRAQRIAIQHWTADNPAAGIKAGQVTVVNGGDIAKTLGLVPAEAAYTETSDKKVNAPAPTATPTPAATATPTPAPVPATAFSSKEVTTPPTDCGSGNRVPCLASAPNGGDQFIQGHVLERNGNGVAGVTVLVTAYGKSYPNVSEGDGLFTFTLSTNCPKENRTYTVFLVDGSGNQISDARVVNYSDCNVAGEFHFDFVRNS